ncbi:hypothetical protein [Halarchaeum nitratireducens]|uniref:Uncharacterized protein n=1 Tax=Halarchaeum nitratireducens TaxID=489913 RepID=A0A830GD25_9EURY|nr:hypothetical protein [Halarchaeum nitratireducens]GGN20300.1 hypothetical protein GCM10009021_21710 [Halarchaeum nitratireducens]
MAHQVGEHVNLSTTSARKAILVEFSDEKIHDILDERFKAGIPDLVLRTANVVEVNVKFW